MATTTGEPRWLLLIHQIPPQPSYLRVKVGRRLQTLGAVAVKNSVYVLPSSEQALEDLQWVRRDVVSGGGDATLCEARFVAGLSDAAVETMFNAARDDDYAALAREARDLQRSLGRRRRQGSEPGQAASAVLRLRKQLSEVAAIDFFGAPGRGTVEGLLASIDAALRSRAGAPAEAKVSAPRAPGGVWITRTGVHVDRIASAWLIRRFIDPEATFKFVRGHDYRPEANEVRFDMYDAEFTHEGELCTFEVLRQRFGLGEPALVRIGELVHDIDLKDGKFDHAETCGLDHLIAGIAMRHKDDEDRLRDGAAAFEALYEYFRRKAP